jgi:hypothetical protein
MKKVQQKAVEQPKPFTPGVTRGMVRQHAFELFRDKLTHGTLTLQDWVLAEKDLVNEMETDGVLKR